METPKKTVLCIEDEYFISELYTRALSKNGYETNVKLDGSSGLQEALSGDYDIILLDLMLPQITGIDVLREIRKSHPDLRSKIVITTNLDVKESLRQELEQMADGYIIKAEITPMQLVEFLNQIKINKK